MQFPSSYDGVFGLQGTMTNCKRSPRFQKGLLYVRHSKKVTRWKVDWYTLNSISDIFIGKLVQIWMMSLPHQMKKLLQVWESSWTSPQIDLFPETYLRQWVLCTENTTHAAPFLQIIRFCSPLCCSQAETQCWFRYLGDSFPSEKKTNHSDAAIQMCIFLLQVFPL